MGHRWLMVCHHSHRPQTTDHVPRADGTVLRSYAGEVGIDPARPPHTAAHGVWRYLGHGRFGVTIWDIFYDVTTGQLLRYNRLRLEVTLDDDDRDKGSARAIIEVIDPQGVVVSSRSGTSSLGGFRSSRSSRPRS